MVSMSCSPQALVQLPPFQCYLKTVGTLFVLKCLCHQAVFLLCDAVRKRGLCCRPVSKILSNFFFSPVAPWF